jgi:uncharacterized coiled-coil DUF342 family protein
LKEKQETDEIEAINQHLDALKEQISKSSTETRANIEKRDKLNQQFKEKRQEINELKNERDNLNEKVKTLKWQRDETRAQIRANVEEIKSHRQKVDELKKKTPQRSQQDLQKEFDSIEWKIQTTSLDLQEEKRLVENVRQIETELNVYKKIDQHIKKTAELRKQLEAFQTNADAAHEELTATAQKSQEIHAKMLAKINESKSIKEEADRIHKAYIQEKEQTKPFHEEIKKLMEKRKRLQDAKRDEEEKQKKNTEQALKEKLGSQARDKLQRGEKLSWNEFQLLGDDESENA